MINFKEYLKEDIDPVYFLSDFERQQVDIVLKRYLKVFDPDILNNKAPEEFYKKQLLGLQYAPINGTYNLGYLKYDGGDVSVVVNFDKNFLAKASYEEQQNVIEIFYYHFDNLLDSQKRTAIVHELFHAKQEDKSLSPEYRKSLHRRSLGNGRVTVRSKRGYYFSKNEFTIHVSTILFEIDRQYRYITDNINKTNSIGWKKVKERFFSGLLRFIEHGNIKELPPYLNDEQDFVKTIFRNRNNFEMVKYYDFLRDRLYDKYTNLLELEKK